MKRVDKVARGRCEFYEGTSAPITTRNPYQLGVVFDINTSYLNPAQIKCLVSVWFLYEILNWAVMG